MVGALVEVVLEMEIVVVVIVEVEVKVVVDDVMDDEKAKEGNGGDDQGGVGR